MDTQTSERVVKALSVILGVFGAWFIYEEIVNTGFRSLAPYILLVIIALVGTAFWHHKVWAKPFGIAVVVLTLVYGFFKGEAVPVLLGCGYIFTGIGLWLHKAWARIVSVVLGTCMLIFALGVAVAQAIAPRGAFSASVSSVATLIPQLTLSTVVCGIVGLALAGFLLFSQQVKSQFS